MTLVTVDVHPKFGVLTSVDVTISSLHHGVCLPNGSTIEVPENGCGAPTVLSILNLEGTSS